jgi:cytochrome c oxidase subunit IV
MEHSTHSDEITYHHEPASTTRRIWKTFWILLVLTMIELALGFSLYYFNLPGWMHLFFKGLICILTLAKAFYIVSIFMHLGDEIRNMVMTVVVPLLLFIWFISAFLWDGNSYRTSRNRYDKYKMERTLPREEKAGDTMQHGFGG